MGELVTADSPAPDPRALGSAKGKLCEEGRIRFSSFSSPPFIVSV